MCGVDTMKPAQARSCSGAYSFYAVGDELVEGQGANDALQGQGLSRHIGNLPRSELGV